MRTAIAAALGAALTLAAAAAAMAQTTGVVAGSAPVDVGSVYTSVLQPVLMAAGSAAAIIITAAAGYAVQWLRKKTGIQELEIDAQHRDALQAALTNAAGIVLNNVGNDLKGKTIDVGSPAVQEAVKYVVSSAPDALQHFDLNGNATAIAEKIVAKIPQVANTTSAPT